MFFSKLGSYFCDALKSVKVKHLNMFDASNINLSLRLLALDVILCRMQAGSFVMHVRQIGNEQNREIPISKIIQQEFPNSQ